MRVAVAVTKSPEVKLSAASSRLLKLASPLASVMTVVEPR